MLSEYYWQFYYIATTQFPNKLELVTRGTRAEFVGNLTQVLEKTDLKFSLAATALPELIFLAGLLLTGYSLYLKNRRESSCISFLKNYNYIIDT